HFFECDMDKSPSRSSVPSQQASGEEHVYGFEAETSVAQQASSNAGKEPPSQENIAVPEVVSNPSESEGEEKSGSTPPAEQAETLAPDTDEQVEDKGKERETQMSYPGDYYHYSRMASGQSEREKTSSSTANRRPDTSRSSSSSGSNSSASTPRQGSEAARDNKKDDKSGSGGGSGGASTSGGGSASGSSRSRLVAGVFVRY
ncbi:hypothetical protein H2200_006300, partial [Cladophialophora chaetospira]